MSAGMAFVLFKGFLGFFLPLALAFRELRKYREQDEAELARREAGAARQRPEPLRKAA